jgi:hypothetical protein
MRSEDRPLKPSYYGRDICSLAFGQNVRLSAYFSVSRSKDPPELSLTPFQSDIMVQSTTGT